MGGSGNHMVIKVAGVKSRAKEKEKRREPACEAGRRFICDSSHFTGQNRGKKPWSKMPKQIIHFRIDVS